MDVEAVVRSIRAFAKKHKVTLSEIPTRQSAMLELAAVTGVQEHYKSNGFDIEVRNPASADVFRIKTTTRGHPWNFSHIHLKKGSLEAELHMNLVVTGAHDKGRYCVDVALTKPGVVPARRPASGSWLCIEN